MRGRPIKRFLTGDLSAVDGCARKVRKFIFAGSARAHWREARDATWQVWATLCAREGEKVDVVGVASLVMKGENAVSVLVVGMRTK